MGNKSHGKAVTGPPHHVKASTYNVGVMFFVFHDGELGQISQFQKVPLNRKTCTIIGNIELKGIAEATHTEFLRINNDSEIDSTISKAIEITKNNRPVLIDVKIDYSQKTMLTKGALKVNLSRFPLKEKIRFISRALKRHVTG